MLPIPIGILNVITQNHPKRLHTFRKVIFKLLIKIKYRFGSIKQINQTLYALKCFDVHTIACTEASGTAIRVKWYKL